MQSIAQSIRTDARMFTAQELIEDVLVAGGCVNNVMVTNAISGDFNGSDLSYGYFEARGTNFPFEEGIILSTGRIGSAEGPNRRAENSDDAPGWVGDADIERELNTGDTVNATVIEFEFTSESPDVNFRYFFASEEYRQNTSTTCEDDFSDAFAFLIRERGTTAYENLAVVPGTTIPIEVTTVRPDIFDRNGNLACSAENEQFFDTFNPVSQDAAINFNGQTTILNATTTITPNIAYEVKLVIVDKENERFDSAVFLEAQSFGENTDLGDDFLINNGSAACDGETIILQAIEEPMGVMYQYQWFRNGVLQPETTSQFDVTTSGTYEVRVTLDNGCMLEDDIDVEFFNGGIVNDTTLTSCDRNSDNTETFNLLDSEADILQGVTNYRIDGFYNSENAAEMDIASERINNPTAYATNTPNEIVFARILTLRNCVDVAEVELIIQTPTPVNSEQIIVCGENNMALFNPADASALFDMQTIDTNTYRYFRNQSDADNDTNQITTEQLSSQTLIVLIDNPTTCYSDTTLDFGITETPQLPEDETVIFCFTAQDTSVTLSADASNDDGSFSYMWSTGETSETIEVQQSGRYMVTVTNTNSGISCSNSRSVTVVQQSTTQVSVTIEGDFPNFNVIVDAGGTGDFSYALDNPNEPFQESNIFQDVAPGEHVAYVQNGSCGVTSQAFALLDFPKFFTPNNDGFNERWNVRNNAAENNVRVIYIFDRFGKLLKTLNPNAAGWDGTFNGRQMPSSDYWFLAEFQSGFEFKNHFTLKR